VELISSLCRQHNQISVVQNGHIDNQQGADIILHWQPSAQTWQQEVDEFVKNILLAINNLGAANFISSSLLALQSIILSNNFNEDVNQVQNILDQHCKKYNDLFYKIGNFDSNDMFYKISEEKVDQNTVFTFYVYFTNNKLQQTVIRQHVNQYYKLMIAKFVVPTIIRYEKIVVPLDLFPKVDNHNTPNHKKKIQKSRTINITKLTKPTTVRKNIVYLDKYAPSIIEKFDLQLKKIQLGTVDEQLIQFSHQELQELLSKKNTTLAQAFPVEMIENLMYLMMDIIFAVDFNDSLQPVTFADDMYKINVTTAQHDNLLNLVTQQYTQQYPQGNQQVIDHGSIKQLFSKVLAIYLTYNIVITHKLNLIKLYPLYCKEFDCSALKSSFIDLKKYYEQYQPINTVQLFINQSYTEIEELFPEKSAVLGNLLREKEVALVRAYTDKIRFRTKVHPHNVSIEQIFYDKNEKSRLYDLINTNLYWHKKLTTESFTATASFRHYIVSNFSCTAAVQMIKKYRPDSSNTIGYSGCAGWGEIAVGMLAANCSKIIINDINQDLIEPYENMMQQYNNNKQTNIQITNQDLLVQSTEFVNLQIKLSYTILGLPYFNLEDYQGINHHQQSHIVYNNATDWAIKWALPSLCNIMLATQDGGFLAINLNNYYASKQVKLRKPRGKIAMPRVYKTKIELLTPVIGGLINAVKDMIKQIDFFRLLRVNGSPIFVFVKKNRNEIIYENPKYQHGEYKNKDNKKRLFLS
jgi:hypothetical protein